MGVISLCVVETLLIVRLYSQMLRRKRTEKELRESEARLQTSQVELRVLAGRLLNSQEDERRRIARDLHDDINQSLALLSVELDLLAQKPEETASRPGGRLRHLSNMVKQLSTSVHELSHRLHPSKLEQLGLVAAIRSLCKEFSQSHGLAIEFIDGGVPVPVSDDVALCLYRIAQEALQNVVKHSGAQHAAGRAERNRRRNLPADRRRRVGFRFPPAEWPSGTGTGARQYPRTAQPGWWCGHHRLEIARRNAPRCPHSAVRRAPAGRRNHAGRRDVRELVESMVARSDEAPAKRPRVLLADDHRMLRDVFTQLLEPACDVVGAVADGRALLTLASELRPDIVVLDIGMPLLNGLDAARQLKDANPEIKLIFLTMSEDPDVAAEAFRAARRAISSKTPPPRNSCRRSRKCLRGDRTSRRRPRRGWWITS